LNPSVVGGLGDEEFIYELQDNQDVVLVEGDLNAELGGG